MVSDNDLSPSLRGKPPSEWLPLIRAVVQHGLSGDFSLSAVDNMILTKFVAQLVERHTADDALLLAVSRIVRQYEQHLIARAANQP